MDEKNVMEELLNITKGACDLYMHGAVEASTENVHNTFNDALNETIKMQNEIYTKMAGKGWYQTQQAEQQMVSQVKQKFSAQA